MLQTITCGVVLEQEGQLLLVQEAAPEIYGKWNQPSGHWDPGETLFDCAVREAQEESGYQVELTGLQAIYTYATETRQRVNFCFNARPLGRPSAVDPTEIVTTRWFSKSELQELTDDQLRHPLARLRIDDWLAGKTVPMELITPWSD